MNRYIFLTTSIRNIGGAQLYISRKLDWLKKEGWDVDVYYYNDGEIKIDNLKAYSGNYIKALSIPYPLITERIFSAIVKKVKNKGGYGYDFVFLESHTIQLSLIGEKLAKELNAAHMLYWLSENHPKSYLIYSDFFKCKLKVNALYCISDVTLTSFMGYSELTKNRGLVAIGSASNNIEDIPFPLGDQTPFADYNILSLGRLEKPYMDNMISGIISFMKYYPQNTLKLYLVGGAAEVKDELKIKNKLKHHENIFPIFVGYMHPVPRRIFQIVDMALTSSGSSWLPYSQNVPTVTFDANDLQPIGILGYTTRNPTYRKDNEPIYSVETYLENILVKKIKYDKIPNMRSIPSENLDYSSHSRVMNEIVRNKRYCDIILKRSLKEKILLFFIFLFGPSFYYLMKNIKNFLPKRFL